MEDWIRFGSREYGLFLILLLLARGADFLSTWVATPRMVLEGNPLAKKLGWKWGGLLNLATCLVFAAWPLAALVVVTTSLLVAARNFQSAWLMRTLGEEAYRDWYVRRLVEARLPVYLFCLGAQGLLILVVGAGLIGFSGGLLVPFAVGLGVVTYAVAVMFYTLLALWRIRRVLG